MQSLLYAFYAIFPVFTLILLGFILKRTKFINDEFITVSTRVVFRVAMPVLVVRNIAATDFSRVFNISEVLLTISVTIIFYLASWFLAGRLSREPKEHGPFVQGSFRSNIAIVATAIAINMYGPEGAARVAIHLCFLMPVYNILAVIVLAVSSGRTEKISWGKVLSKIATNPLILAVVVSLPMSIFSIPIPRFLQGAVNYTAQLTLPLALLGIGGSLSFRAFGKHPILAVTAGTIKLIILPAVTVAASLLLNMELKDPGVLFLVMGSPTAVASFIMTKEMGGDEVLQANIVALTTCASMVTLGLGIFLLKFLGMI